MKRVVIVSEDQCIIHQILNNIEKFHCNISTIIYQPKDFKIKISQGQLSQEEFIYFIDIYNMQDDFLEIIRKIRDKDKSSKIIIIGMNNNITFLLKSQFCIYNCLEKWNNFDKQVKNILSTIIKEKKNKDYNTNIEISNDKIPIMIRKEEIECIYQLPNEQISIQYKNGKNSILISRKQVTPRLKELTQNDCYLDRAALKSSKRTYYSEPFKQLLVDLYLIFKVDCNTLSKHFHVDIKYIKKWASLSKYTRKMNILEWIIGKYIIQSYLKK